MGTRLAPNGLWEMSPACEEILVKPLLREYFVRTTYALGVAALLCGAAMAAFGDQSLRAGGDTFDSQSQRKNPGINPINDKRHGERFRVPQVRPGNIYGSWFDTDFILSDGDRRVGEDFMIPPALANRVGFWFDIYSKYDSFKRVIHHSQYPWIIFKVIDTEPIISSTYPKFRWQRNQIADELVKKQVFQIRQALISIANKRKISDLDTDKLTDDEVAVKNGLELLGKDIRRLAKTAAKHVRVQTGQRNFFAEGLQLAPRYLSRMEEIFAGKKLPVELTRLPLVESSFNKHATSKVGAAGIWQFMKGTGRKKKLTIDSFVDERKSPFKATEAAALLLKENHLILHKSWELAITAWNHGPSGIKRASQHAGSKDLARIIESYSSKRFSFASENFYSEFLAALYTERYSDLIFPGLPRMAPVDVEEIRLTRAVKLDEITELTSLSLEDFVVLNPDLEKLVKARRALYKGLRIMVPPEAKAIIDVKMAKDSRGKRLIGAND